ncbi:MULTISPECIES: hypothetical protein [unclassified Neorhizobium]|uniref:hypothetical protein n=1 Tax=unclassified Neorhizobium TaxID=2629175 RepID=UPI001FF51714|nr:MULTISPECIES: hypothetical protein [unclassified Neorhizobium]MCJ9670922.1 hypothetical protein [Neorhizobium sp. SHOUNA12B]MCJ9747310.1 hypothetical protein [Neorhizobium sp. SHOUNA12A]
MSDNSKEVAEKIENYVSEEEDATGDDLYSSLGFDPIDNISSTVYLVPPINGPDVLIGYRLALRFAGDETVIKTVPFDDFVALINSLTKVLSLETIERHANVIETLNFKKETLVNLTNEAIGNLTELLKFLKKFQKATSEEFQVPTESFPPEET